MSGVLPIRGDDLWVKVVEMLQQNWAAIEPEPSGSVRVCEGFRMPAVET